MRSTYAAKPSSKTSHLKSQHALLCSCKTDLRRRRKKLYCIFKLKLNTFAAGVPLCRNKWPLSPRLLVSVCGFHLNARLSQTTHRSWITSTGGGRGGGRAEEGGGQGKELWMKVSILLAIVPPCLVRCT